MGMEQGGDRELGLEVEDGKIYFRLRGSRLPRNMPYANCSGVSINLTPSVSAFGMTVRYRVDLLDRGGDSAIQIGDTPSLKEAWALWRRAADELEKPALIMTPDGRKADSAPAAPPPAGITRYDWDGRTRVVVRRSPQEYVFAAVLAVGLGAALILGEPKEDDLIFMFVAAGLMAYAVIAGLSSRFIELADGILTAGLRTPLGVFAKVEMPLSDVEAVLWGFSARGWGKYRSAFAFASKHGAKSFDRLTEDQAKWLTRFVRGAVRG
jgi:hypothetical protein